MTIIPGELYDVNKTSTAPCYADPWSNEGLDTPCEAWLKPRATCLIIAVIEEWILVMPLGDQFSINSVRSPVFTWLRSRFLVRVSLDWGQHESI